MKLARPLAVLLGLCCTATPLFGQTPDALDEALALAGLQRADLGWTPKGWWPQFPADIRYKLRAFDSLFNEPLDVIAYTRSLAQAAKDHLDPAVVNERRERGTTPLHHAVHRLGINPKFGGLRGYAANLTAEDTPLDSAILALHHAADRPTHAFTFYMELPYPKPAEDLAERIKVVPEAAQPVLISKTGDVDLVLTSANVGSGFEAATFEARGGRLIGVHDPRVEGKAAGF